MKDLEAIQKLFAYTAWADSIVWTAVINDADASTDKRIRDYLFHLHMVQGIFLKAWQGEPLISPSDEAPNLAAILALAQSTHERLAMYCSKLEESKLSEAVTLPWAGRVIQLTGKEPAMSTLGDTLLQVVNHSTYHRGQVNARLRALGGEPPMTDYIAWVWLGKPEAAWPA